ncbi:MAG: porin family protein, partial [Saprospiraceae bacterium]
MKRTVAKILCTSLVLFSTLVGMKGQDRDLRIGFQTSPMISWIGNNDNQIVKNGGSFGIKLGSTVDIYFKDNYSFTTGINLAFHEGGEFQYDIGGNYLPKSDLSDPMLQTGDKPLPDGTRIRYSLQYVEIPLGLKIRSKEIGYIRYFVEAPVFNFAFLTRGRATIETDVMKFDRENIYKDLSVVNVFWGFGAGIEYSISENNALVGGIYYQNGLLDFTRDNGNRAIANPTEDPNDPNDNYLKQKDDSRATVNNLV